MLSPPPFPSLPVLRAGLITRRLRLAGDGPRLFLAVTGRTGSGKTTLANRLLGVDYFLSHGGQDCTREINLIRFPGGLVYGDLPGACSDDRLENLNRAALGLGQVPDFPAVAEVPVAEYAAAGPPARSAVAVAAFPAAYPPPDLLLYLLAADKQFTSDDRRYLTDLLGRPARVVFVLNVFATAPPTAANVADVVGAVAAIHRRARGGPPRVVAVDCRTGDGLADLLAAARAAAGPQGQLLADLLADVARETPRAFARGLREYLIGQAAAAAALTGGPITGPGHGLHQRAIAVLEAIGALRAEAPPAAASCAARYAAAIAAAGGAGPAAGGSARPGGVRSAAATALVRAIQGRDALRAATAAARAEGVAEAQRRSAAPAPGGGGDELERQRAAVEQAEADLQRRVEAFRAAGAELQVEEAQLTQDIDDHNDRQERHRDRVEEFNDALDRLRCGGPLDPATVRTVEREAERLNREGERLNREVPRLRREQDRFNRRVAERSAEADDLNAAVAAVKARIAAFNAAVAAHNHALQERVRARAAAIRAWEAEAWAAQRFGGAADRALRDLEDGCAALAEALHQADARADVLRRLAGRPGFNAAAAAQELDAIEAALLATTAGVAAALTQARGRWAEFVVARAASGLILATATDHLDEAGTVAHRGTTYRPLGADAAALMLAVGQWAVSGQECAAEFPPLFRAVRSALAAATEPLTEEAWMTHLQARPEVFTPEWGSAVERMEVFGP